MTCLAGQILVRTIQFEKCLVMIKFIRFPVVKIMAGVTIYLSLFGKLSEMDILMTIDTSVCQIAELLMYCTCCAYSKMTGPAALLLVFSFE